jgi:Fe2+ or Zn2+ uptake regulation protein
MNSPNSKLVPQSTHRQTAQRDQVLEVLKNAGGPLTAPEIYSLVRKYMPEIALATFYRALKLMQDDERVRYICLPDGVSRYEIVGLGQHHFQCRVCHRI